MTSFVKPLLGGGVFRESTNSPGRPAASDTDKLHSVHTDPQCVIITTVIAVASTVC